jgi:pimeloyl-ACP methyl ester carboxylesterase
MKNIIKIILLFLLSITLSDIKAQQIERMIFWLHGLGGNRFGWDRVREATDINSLSPAVSGFPKKKVHSPLLGYEIFQNNMEEASNSVIVSLEAADGWNNTLMINDKTKNFIIAHSMGGLVARDVDRKYAQQSPLERRFGGIVTFGTPHQGARILNNKDLFSHFAFRMCADLTAGPITEFGNNISNQFPFFNLIFNGAWVHEKFLTTACGPLSDLVPSLFANFTPGITNDFFVGASKLNEINDYPSNLPKVAFWGKETPGTEMWRELSSLLLQKPDLATVPSFGGDDDNQLVEFRNSAIQHFTDKRNLWQSLTDAWPWCNWYQWITMTGYCIYSDGVKNNQLDNITGYQKGIDWLNNANEDWRVIIGAKRFDEVGTSTEYECNCSEYDYDGNTIYSWTTSVADINDCVGNGWLTGCSPTGNTVTVSNFQFVDEASDGIVVESSAKGFPQGTSPEPTPNRIMDGSNHQQMRNDSNTKARLLELFNGQFGNYFITN